MVFELHDMRIICLLKAVTPAWVINTALFTLTIDYILYYGSFEVLQPRSIVFYRLGPRVRSRVP